MTYFSEEPGPLHKNGWGPKGYLFCEAASLCGGRRLNIMAAATYISGGRRINIWRPRLKYMTIQLIHPLFFSDGMNCFGLVNKFKYDTSTDVRSTQLMHDGESVKDLVKRLREKNLTCYILAKEQELYFDSADSDSLESVTDIVQKGSVNSSLTPVSGKLYFNLIEWTFCTESSFPGKESHCHHWLRHGSFSIWSTRGIITQWWCH